MDWFWIGQFALKVALTSLALDVIVWLLWANKVILEQQSDTLLRWNVGLVMLIWLLASVVAAISSVGLMIYAW